MEQTTLSPAVSDITLVLSMFSRSLPGLGRSMRAVYSRWINGVTPSRGGVNGSYPRHQIHSECQSFSQKGFRRIIRSSVRRDNVHHKLSEGSSDDAPSFASGLE